MSGVKTGNPVELAEDISSFLFRNSRAAVDHVDAQLSSATAAAHDYSTRVSVAKCVRNQIEQYPLKKYHVASHPQAALHHAQCQSFFSCGVSERRFQPLNNVRDGKFSEIRIERSRIQLRN